MDIDNRCQLRGLGAYLGSHVIQWDQLQVTYHVHLLERVECAEAFLSHDKGSPIMIRTDNTTGVHDIMTQEGTYSPQLCIWTLKMWTWCISHSYSEREQQDSRCTFQSENKTHRMVLRSGNCKSSVYDFHNAQHRYVCISRKSQANYLLLMD